MKKRMTITDFLKKYSADESFKTLRETEKSSTGEAKKKAKERVNIALKNASMSKIVSTEGARYKASLPDSETRRKLENLMKFRRNIEAMRVKTNRMMAIQKNNTIAAYLLDLDSLLSKGLSKATEIEKIIKQVAGNK